MVFAPGDRSNALLTVLLLSLIGSLHATDKAKSPISLGGKAGLSSGSGASSMAVVRMQDARAARAETQPNTTARAASAVGSTVQRTAPTSTTGMGSIPVVHLHQEMPRRSTTRTARLLGAVLRRATRLSFTMGMTCSGRAVNPGGGGEMGHYDARH